MAIISQQTHLFKLEDMLVKVKLQFFICKVDTKLFKTVVLVILKSKNVQNSYRASLELRKRGHHYSTYPKMSICYCALQLTQSWWLAGVTISKLEMDCPSSKSSFLLDNVCQKDYILVVHLGRINHQILSVYLSLSFKNGLLVWDDNLSLASILTRFHILVQRLPQRLDLN